MELFYFFLLCFQILYIFYKVLEIKGMLLIAFLLITIKAELLFLNRTSCPGCSSKFQYTQIQTENNFLVSLEVYGTTECISYEPFLLPKSRYCYQKQSASKSLPQMRTAPTQVDRSGKFITFYPSNVIIHQNLTNQTLKSLNFSSFRSYSIKDACFGSGMNQIFVLIEASRTLNILIFNNSINFQVSKSISLSSFDKLICKNGLFAILFTSKVEFYSLNSSLNFLKQINFSAVKYYELDMEINEQILVIARGYEILLYNITSGFTLKSSKVMTEIISGVDIIEPCYIVVSSKTSLYQLDYEINLFILSKVVYLFPSYTYRTFRIDGNTVIVSLDYMVSPCVYPYIYYFSISKFSQLSTGYCEPTYQFVPQIMKCLKIGENLTNAIIQTSNLILNHTFNSSQIINGTIWSRSEGVTVDNTSNLFSYKQKGTQENEEESEQNLAKIFSDLQKQQKFILLQVISCVFIVSSFKFTPQFLLLMVNVVDDLSYYKFHIKQYPATVQYFMSNIDIIQSEKLSPEFMDALNTIKSKTFVAIKQNQQMVRYLNIQSLEEEDVYFVRSLVQNYRFPTILSISLFLLIKILSIIAFIAKNKYKCFNKIWKMLRRNSSIWIFLASVIQPVFSRVSFDFGNQIKYLNIFVFTQKLNIIICIILHFAILLYAINFYPLLYRFKKKYSKLISIPSKGNSFSYLLVSAFMLSRIFIRSLIHALVLSNYKLQILCLTIVDFFLIIKCIKLGNNFYNKLIFVCYLALILSFFSFDLFFFLQEMNLLPTHHKRQLFGLVIVIFMISCTICSSLVLFFCSLKSVIKLIKKKISQLKMFWNKKTIDKQKALETIMGQKKRKTNLEQKTIKCTTVKIVKFTKEQEQKSKEALKKQTNISLRKRRSNSKIKKVKCARTNIKNVFVIK